MKLLAHTEPDFGSPIVSIFDALNLRSNANPDLKRNVYYDIIKLWPMVPVLRGGRKSSFAFLSTVESCQGRGSKGIAHELVQEYVCKLKQWKIKIYGKEFELKINSTQDEWSFVDFLSGRTYYVDCLLNLSPDSDLYVESGGMIGIEVTDSHPTGRAKKHALKREGLFVLELNTIEDWHIKNGAQVTPDEIKRLRARISGLLENGTFLKCMCKPDDIRI